MKLTREQILQLPYGSIIKGKFRGQYEEYILRVIPDGQLVLHGDQKGYKDGHKCNSVDDRGWEEFTTPNFWDETATPSTNIL